MLRFLIVFSFVLISLNASSQFNGIMSFFSDTTLRYLIKTNGINSVTESTKTDSSINFNGRYNFDSSGRVKEFVTGRHPYYTRVKYEYNNAGSIKKQVNYNNVDTSKIESWTERVFDSNNIMIKSIRGYMYDGKTTVNPDYERKIIVDKKGGNKVETKHYDGPRLLSISISRDSISKTDSLNQSYEYRIDLETGKRMAVAKTIWRSYLKDGCYYTDMVKYAVYGKTETAQKISTEYFKVDNKGRWIDIGEINYDEAYQAYVQEYPEDFNPNYYSPLFIRAILDGKITGEIKSRDARTLNEDGLVLETNSEGYIYTFKYNSKNQLLEQLFYYNQKQLGTLKLWYNEKGLIIKTLNSFKNNQTEDYGNAEMDSASSAESGGEPEMVIEEKNYSYTYY